MPAQEEEKGRSNEKGGAGVTDNDIKKALECCIKDDCDNCPDTFGNCEHNVMRNALDLINRQQARIKKLETIERFATKTIEKQSAEIERLTVNKNACALGMERLAEQLENAKSEAIKEFAEKVETELDERVSENIRNRNPHWYIAKRIVRETAIEMTEVSEK